MAVIERPGRAAEASAVAGVWSRARIWHLAGVVGIILLAAALRFPLLTTIPVGLHFDEAWSGIDAASVTWTHHPVFFTDSNGMEPLYLYLQTISILLFGHTAFALRVVSAVIGTLTVPALYLLVRQLAGRRLGLFAAGVLAVTYWHVHVSRLGYRAIALPLFECLAWWALWNGVQRRDWRWLAAGGAFVGVTLYTYSTARVFPVAVALWFLWLALHRRDWRDLARLVLVGGAALVVFAPLGWYFLQHPQEFIERVGQVIVLSPGVSHSSQPAVLTGVIKTLGMFSFHGDPQWKYNLSGKPTFDPLMSVFFYAGIAWCGYRALGVWGKPLLLTPSPRRGGGTQRRGPWRYAATIVPRTLSRRASSSGHIASPAPVREGSTQRPPDARPAFPLPPRGRGSGGEVSSAAAALLLVWLVVMLVPGFVTTDPPETLHTLATAPAVCTFPALGAAWLWQLVRRWLPSWRRAGVPLAVALVLGEAIATAISYFIIWAPNPQTYYWLHGDVADLAGILKQAPANATIYITTQYYRHPTLRFLAPQVAARAVWFDGQRSLPVRPSGGLAIYAFANGYQPVTDSGNALPAADLVDAPRDSAGGVEYRVYRLPGPAVLPALATPLHLTLGNDLELLDAAVTSPSAAQPEVAHVTLRWRVLHATDRKLSLFVHLLDPSGQRWAQSDGQGFFSSDWRRRDEVLTTVDVHLPVGTPAASLRVSVDFYDVTTGALLPIQGKAILAPDGGAIVGEVMPLPSPMPALDTIPGARLPEPLAPGLQLVGAQLPAAPVTAGDRFTATLYLRKTAAGAPSDPRILLNGVSGDDVEPLPSATLLSSLPVGDVLAIRHQVRIPVRDVDRSAQVQVQAGSEPPVTLGAVAVQPLRRNYAAPSPQHPLAVRFGTVAELVGYDVRPAPGGRKLSVTLYWQALQPTNVAYTVFVHLVAPNGTLLGQHDGSPDGGHWSTTAWLTGQIVADTRELTVADPAALAGAALQVGLYDASAPGLPRLPASGPAGHLAGNAAVLAVGG